MDRLIKIALAVAAMTGIGAVAVHGQGATAPKCDTVVVSKATTADLPALIADAECFGRAAASASSSQVYRLEKAKQLAAALSQSPPTTPDPKPPVATPTPAPSPTGSVRPSDLVKPRPEKLTVTAFSPYVDDNYELTVIERYRPAFAAMGYTIGHHSDYEGCTETEETVCYTWWAAKSANIDATIQTVDFTAPRLWQYGGNLYGQIESERAAEQLLAQVMKTEGY